MNKRYSNDQEGFEEWLEYDDHENIIHSKNSTGTEHWYDADGNISEHSKEIVK